MTELNIRGLTPEAIFLENCNMQRVVELTEAIQRYTDARKPVPEEWFLELRKRTAGQTPPPFPYPSHKSFTNSVGFTAPQEPNDA